MLWQIFKSGLFFFATAIVAYLAVGGAFVFLFFVAFMAFAFVFTKILSIHHSIEAKKNRGIYSVENHANRTQIISQEAKHHNQATEMHEASENGAKSFMGLMRFAQRVTLWIKKKAMAMDKVERYCWLGQIVVSFGMALVGWVMTSRLPIGSSLSLIFLKIQKLIPLLAFALGLGLGYRKTRLRSENSSQ